MSMDLLEQFELKIQFPNADFSSTQKTSQKSGAYNCIAWAAQENNRKWWPDRMQQLYWPRGAPREATMEAFVKAFATLGYESCSDGSLEPGFEKVAIYADAAKRPTHAARQLPDGAWTSKLGDWIDVRHKLEGLQGQKYGMVVQFMKRPRADLTVKS